ncbi:MAG: FG-GAP-like repeat-containing protein [Planctomycetota bacterium]
MQRLFVCILILAAAQPAWAQFPTFFDIASGPEVDGGGSGSGVAVGDFDNDGDLDLYVCNSGSHPPGPSLVPNVLLLNNGGTFSSVTTGPTADTSASQAAACADYDNDGLLDIYLCNEDAANRLYRNTGAGVFADAAAGAAADTGASVSLSWADYDNDGFVDLYIVNSFDPLSMTGVANRLLQNNGGTGFTDVSTPDLANANVGTSAVWGDYDNDGDQDLYLTNDNGEPNILFRNDAGALVAVPAAAIAETGLSSYGATWIDFDNDGNLDLYVANFLGPAKLFKGDGAGGFTDVAAGTPLANPSASPPFAGAGFIGLWADYDNDADLDLYIVNHFTPNVVVRNDGAGVWTDVTGPILAGFGDVHTGGAWADFNADGDVDLYLPNAVGPNRLYSNEEAVSVMGGNGNHWLHVELEGTVSNRSAIGARVEVTTGAVTQTRFVKSGASYLGSDSLAVEFGLGTALTADVVITWPSGIVQSLPGVAADQLIDVLETVSPQFIRGDCNDDGGVDIADAVLLLNFLFPVGTPPLLSCEKACDGNDDGTTNIADAVAILNSLFGSPTVALPVPNAASGCGVDPTNDTLACGATVACP